MSSDVAIEARRLTKSYGRSRGIVDIDLIARSGEVIGLIGANGAGKTTFMRTLLDFVRPTSGSLSVFGLDSVRDSVAVRERTSYLPGELVMPSRLTGHEVLRRFAFTRSREDLARAPEIAERLGLDLGRKVGDLSKGNKQKIGLVLAFAPHADLVVLDEPTSGLDPILQREVATMVRETAARGATVLLSSHVMSEVDQMTSKVALVREGRLHAFEDMDTIRQRARRRGTVRLAEADERDALVTELRRVVGVSDVVPKEDEPEAVTFAVEGSIDAALKVLARHAVASLDLAHADLEDAFFTVYDQGGEPR